MGRNLRKVLGQLPAFVTVFDRKGVVRWATRYDYGFEAATVLGRRGEEFVLEEDRPAWLGCFHRALHRREVAPFCVRAVVPEEPGVVSMEGRLCPVVLAGRVAYVTSVAWEESCPASGKRPPDPPGRWLSPVERAVLAHLVARHPAPRTSKAIASAVAERWNPRFKAILSNLANRGILEGSPGPGYTLAVDPASVVPFLGAGDTQQNN